MIFYHIQAAQNLQYLNDLLSFIYSNQNFYFISVDKTQKAHTSKIAENFQGLDNITIYDDSYITWGGVSQINSMLLAMNSMRHLADKNRIAYRYYINISDSDVPLWSQTKLTGFLRNAETHGHFAFMQYWRPEIDFEAITISEATGAFIYQHRHDIRFSIDNSISHYFDGSMPSPIVNALLRPLLVSYEQPTSKMIHIRPLMTFEKMARARFFAEHGIFIGRQWITLHIDIIDRILTHPNFLTYYKMMADTFIPDEAFFQTIVLNTSNDRNEVVNDNLRHHGADPALLTDAHFEELQSSPGAFARKVVPGEATQILAQARNRFSDEIDEFCRSRGGPPRSSETLPCPGGNDPETGDDRGSPSGVSIDPPDRLNTS